MNMIVAVAILSAVPPARGLDVQMQTMRVTTNQISIALTEDEAKRFRTDGTRGGALLIQCRSLSLVGMSLECQDCKFVAAGMEGTAEKARFDFRNKKAIFTGRRENPVRLHVKATSEKKATTIIGEKVVSSLTALVSPGQDGIRIEGDDGNCGGNFEGGPVSYSSRKLAARHD